MSELGELAKWLEHTRSLINVTQSLTIWTNVVRAARGRCLTSKCGYRLVPIRPTHLRYFTLPCSGVWEPVGGGRRVRVWGREHVGHGKSKRRSRPSSWSLGMCSLGALHRPLIEPSMLQLGDYVNNPKKEIGSVKIPRSLGLRGLMRPSTKHATNSRSSWILLVIAWFVLKMHSKSNK